MPPKSLWNERIETARIHGVETLLEATLERWFTPPFHLTGAESLAKVRKMILGTGVEGFIGCAEAIRDMNLCDRLPEISVPTLIMVGEDDPGCPVSAARTLHDGIIDSKLIIIPQAAHLSNIEQTAVFNKSLIDFLNHHR
jgi:3-oxoadipate enol-lactonase